MSASEKLKVLKRRIQDSLDREQDEHLASERIDDYLNAVRPLRRALPQIVEVVKAAEILAANVHASEIVTDLAEQMDAALTALNKTLDDS